MKISRCGNCMKIIGDGTRFCPYCGYQQDSSRPQNALRRNTVLHNRYLAGKVIGQGGFGITYVGFDLTLEMKVAIKEYYPMGLAFRSNTVSNLLQWNDLGTEQRNQSREGIERFLKEARKMAALDSVPAVVRVRDAFAENETAYIVMDFVEGSTLGAYLRKQGILSWTECSRLLTPVMDSLSDVHRKGFIHRDISPDNIMICPDGRAVLLDMGAAVDISAHEGRASMAVVKRSFSAPEQYMESASYGSWTDVYSLCATIYYCLTARTVPDAMERVCYGAPVEFPKELGVPAGVQVVLLRGLDIDAGTRIRTMQELKELLLRSDQASGLASASAGVGAREPERLPETRPYEKPDRIAATEPYEETKSGNLPETTAFSQSESKQREKLEEKPEDEKKPEEKPKRGIDSRMKMWFVVCAAALLVTVILLDISSGRRMGIREEEPEVGLETETDIGMTEDVKEDNDNGKNGNSGSEEPEVLTELRVSSGEISVIWILSLPEDVMIPEGLRRSDIAVGDVKAIGWTSTVESAPTYCVFYGMDENGEQNFYRYDMIEKTIQLYSW